MRKAGDAAHRRLAEAEDILQMMMTMLDVNKIELPKFVAEDLDRNPILHSFGKQFDGTKGQLSKSCIRRLILWSRRSLCTPRRCHQILHGIITYLYATPKVDYLPSQTPLPGHLVKVHIKLPILAAYHR